MRERIKYYLQSETLKSASYLLTGTVIAQVIGILFVPILTRIYKPADFGIFTSFNAFLILISHFSNGKYAQTIVLHEHDRDAKVLYTLSKIINASVSVLLLAGLIIFFSANWTSNTKYWLLFAPVALFFVGNVEINSFALTREKKFGTISLSKIIQSFVNVFSGIVIGWIGFFTQFGLIASTIISQAITSTYTFFALPKTIDLKIKFYELKNVAIKYKKYSLYGIPGAMIDSFAQQLPIYYLFYLGNEIISGYYGLAVRVVQIPGILIAGSLNNVLFQKMSVLHSEGQSLIPLVRRTATFIAKLLVPVAVLLFLAGPQIFSLVFGASWVTSGEYVRILFVIFTVRIIVSPLSIIFSVKNKLNISFFWQLAYFVFGIAFFYIVYYLKIDFYTVLIYFSLFELTMYSVYFYLIWSLAKVPNAQRPV